ncbi:MAG: Trp family transcriptional regulator [Spirochaetota bacterium]
MKNISEISNKKDWEIRIWAEFLKNAEMTKSAKQIVGLFDKLLSKSEKKSMAKRIAAISMIRAGKSYKEISRILWISPKTISALKKSVAGEGEYKSSYYYSEKNEKEKRDKIKPSRGRTIFDYWADMPWPTKTGKGRWKYLDYQD